MKSIDNNINPINILLFSNNKTFLFTHVIVIDYYYRKNSYLLQNKKEVLMNLLDQVQQFKSFFKENILITFKNESSTPSVKSFVPQLQDQYLSTFHRLDSSNSFYSFLNYPSLEIDKNYPGNNNSTSSSSTFKINIIHPIFNDYTKATPIPIRSTLYYQYLPPSSKPTLKSKLKSKSNQNLTISSSSSSSSSSYPTLPFSNSIGESYLPSQPSIPSSSQIKKELRPTISLPNLNSSSSVLTVTSSTKTLKNENRHPSLEEDSSEKEEDGILLCSITQGIEEGQQTLKKLQKKVNLLRKENQDLLDNIFAKRMAKEHPSIKNNTSSLSLQQIKIISP